jgi:MoaA/NifB/PqqE/SkfB family radical SAM enzyme
MKRFPLWLRAKLLRARIAQGLRGKGERRLVLRLDSGSHVDFSSPSGSERVHSPLHAAELLDLVRASDAPVVWIGGSEPLAHPGTGKLARRIADCGRTVFVQMDGFYLRQRIHEFRPVSRLFLTLDFYGLQRSNDLRAGRDGTFGRAIEGMRTAKLSGFLICGHVLVDAETDLGEVAQLREQLLAMDADGLFASVAPRALREENRTKEIVERKLMETRKIVESGGWEAFSRLMEKEFRGVQEKARGARESGRTSEQREDVAEEGVEVR